MTASWIRSSIARLSMASIVSEILRHLDTEAQTESLFDFSVD